MNTNSQKLIEKVLSMDDKQLKSFLSRLDPDTLEYLELLIGKAEEEYAE